MSTQLQIQQNNASLGDREYRFILYNPTTGDTLESYYIPDGWTANELKLARSKQYHGVIKSVSTKELVFLKDTRDFLQKAYEAGNVNAVVSVTIYRFNYYTYEYDLYHIAAIDFTTYSIDEVGVSVQLMSNEFWTKFLARSKTKINLRSLTSVEGLNVTDFDFNDITLPDTNLNNIAEFYDLGTPFITDLVHIVPATLTATDFPTEVHTQTFGDPINDKDSGIVTDATISRQLNLVGNISGEFLGTGGSFDASVEIIAYVLDEDSNIISSTGLGLESGSGVYNLPFSFDFDTIIEVLSGESLLIQATINNDEQKFSYSSVDFNMEETVEGTPEVTRNGFLIYEAFLRVLQLIMDADNPFYSTFFGRTDTPFTVYPTDGELIALIKGIYFRGYSSEPISISLDDLFSALFSIYGLSLNNEVIDGVEKIRVEDLEYAYDSTVILDISERINGDDIKKTVYPELIFSDIEIGYNKYTYEQTGGLFEFCTKLNFSTVIRTIANKLTEVAKLRADYNGIKVQLLADDPQKDAKGDNDNFLLTVRRDSGEFVARLDEDYDYVGGSFYANKTFNLDISPARNLRRLKDFIRGSLLKELNTFVRWQASETSSKLYSKRTDETYEVDEDGDVRVNDLEGSLWIPETYEVAAPLTNAEVSTLLTNSRGLIKLADQKYGWILDVTTKNKDKLTEFKLLRANLDYVIPYPLSGAIRLVKDTKQTVDESTMVIAGSGQIFADWGNGALVEIDINNFTKGLHDGDIIVLYGNITSLSIDGSIKFSHVSAVKHSSLVYLSIPDNNLTGADLRDSTKLATVKINDNLLETVYVTGCDHLSWLRMYDNPTMSINVDVSECIRLAKYENYSCSQTAINVSACQYLSYLDCRTNNISEIDLTSNEYLKTLSIRINSSLTEIDLSGNPRLEWIEAKACPLNTFDLSNNPLLVYLQLDYCSIPVADVNNMLIDLDNFGESGGYIDIENQTPNAPPSGAGATALANLISKSWSTQTD